MRLSRGTGLTNSLSILKFTLIRPQEKALSALITQPDKDKTDTKRISLMQMPVVNTLDEYRAIYHRDDIWRPVIDAICHRYTFLQKQRVRGPDGTHIVYLVGDTYVVKLFVPLFDQDFVAERTTAKHLVGKIGLETPEIVAEGQIKGWNYLIMSRISGLPLDTIWDALQRTERLKIARNVGQMIARLRDVPVSGLDEITFDWRTFLIDQIAEAYDHPPLPELAWEPKQEIRRFFESLSGLMDEGFQPVLLLADITREHVFVERLDGEWQMVGYLDFGDAMVGHPDYEFVAPGLEIGGGNPEILQTLLITAGYPVEALDETLCRRLMAYTLIHRYVDLTSVFSEIPQAVEAANLDELAQRVWPIQRKDESYE
jgi:hygromycin-B 7''-O-kinase